MDDADQAKRTEGDAVITKLKNLCAVTFHDPNRKGEGWEDVVVVKRHEAFGAAEKDLAAIEARHVEEIAKLTAEWNERLHWMMVEGNELREKVNKHAEEIAQARREAYEDAAKQLMGVRWDATNAGYFYNWLREKAGKL